MAYKTITKRWLINSLGVILVILITFEIVFAFGIRNYYYGGVRQIANSRADVIVTTLLGFYEADADKYDEYVMELVEGFDYKDRMELMAVDVEGTVAFTSSGFVPGKDEYMPDYIYAMETSGDSGEFIGTIRGENIFAITRLLPVSGVEHPAIRIVVSLSLVDRQIVLMIAAITVVCVAIVCFVIFSSAYFINSIVIPVGMVGDTARKIAQGNFETRLEKKNDDEIGDLCDVINYMAGELGESEKMKNDFISSVSHELRTPLTAIKGWSETILEADDKETVQKGMHVIINETERLSQMVEELLDFSRIQSGRLSIISEKLDIIAEVSDVVLMFTERARREGIILEFDEPEDMIVVMGDKNRLRQVFINILDNAMKYSHADDKIIVSAVADKENVVISIQDFGEGIDAEDLPKIKTRFYKGASSKRGSGIGLAVADSIIEMHGGKLDIESQKGFGTNVLITLPLSGKH
ncbi:MAG: HAMP domain-containing histidine kinase [Ruminococcaceae bacterium]|nr:HAMP domain-containing histidine kinase [Oscillospiraceae bacterium]